MLKKILSVVFILVALIIMENKTMAGENLSVKQQNMVMIASYTATGQTDNLKTVIKKGLDEGLTVNEIKEILIQMYA